MNSSVGAELGAYSLLLAELRSSGPALIAFSGGVDSSFLLVAAREALGSDLRAIIGISPSLQQENRERAHRIAARFDVPLEEWETGETEDPLYLRNDAERCYFCKAHLFGLLSRIASDAGERVVYDGTHADDSGTERPGRRAAAQFGIRSPLAELGWTKAAIREESLRLGLETWNEPASPCLSSRIQRGIPVTVPALRRIESAEVWLRQRGFDTVRVRDEGGWARVEVDASQVSRCQAEEDGISDHLRSLGFAKVRVDPVGYRMGGGNTGPGGSGDGGQD